MKSTKIGIKKSWIHSVLLSILIITALLVVIMQGVMIASSDPSGPPKDDLDNTTNPGLKVVPMQDTLTIQTATTAVIIPGYLTSSQW